MLAMTERAREGTEGKIGRRKESEVLALRLATANARRERAKVVQDDVEMFRQVPDQKQTLGCLFASLSKFIS